VHAPPLNKRLTFQSPAQDGVFDMEEQVFLTATVCNKLPLCPEAMSVNFQCILICHLITQLIMQVSHKNNGKLKDASDCNADRFTTICDNKSENYA
jgi:hypothetical protein